MNRVWSAVVLLLAMLAPSCAQKKKPAATKLSVVGTWAADPTVMPKGARPAGVILILKPDGSIAVTGPNLKAFGTYKVAGKSLVFTLTSINGKRPTRPTDRTGTFTVADGGRYLLGDSGVRQKGKVVQMRLIRKKA